MRSRKNINKDDSSRETNTQADKRTAKEVSDRKPGDLIQILLDAVAANKPGPTKEDRLIEKLKNNKSLLVMALITLVPFGLVGLGIWKAREIYKKSRNQD